MMMASTIEVREPVEVVVHDLFDALLADLQSTTSHISSYQHQNQEQEQEQQREQHQKEFNSRESTPPPPLPPPPSQDVIDSLHADMNTQPIYEPQTVKQVKHSSTTKTVTRTMYNNGGPPGGQPQMAPPAVGYAVPHQQQQQQPQQLQQQQQQQPEKHMSSLSSNLSELDSLLQDLSSAQFIAEVDRRNAANMSQQQVTPNAEQYHSQQYPPQMTPTGGQGDTVDSLLNQLDNFMPPPTANSQPPAQSPVPVQNNIYEQVQPRQVTSQVQVHQVSTQQSGGMQQGGMQQGGMQQGGYQQGGMQQGGYQQGGMQQGGYQQGGVQQGGYQQGSMQQGGYAQVGVQQGVLQEGGIPQTPTGPASTATRELDDLMASLSEFKVSPAPQHIGDPPYAQPDKGPRAVITSQPAPQTAHTEAVVQNAQQSNNLETMLGDLQTDMSRQGVMTVPKGHCAACAKPIIGQVITALGKIWHPEHFMCSVCKEPLGTKNFFERDSQPYCERDYHTLFSPRCAHCNGPILDKCVTALDRTWHPEHFVCAHCGRPFGEGGFHEKDGKAFCRDDYFDIFAPKCGGCSRPIMDNYISALNRQWHPECFVCKECGMPFGASSFYDHDGFPYCETHYHARRGSLCAGCHKPITGRCITAMYKKFHPEHFVCAFCLKQLNKGTFKEQNDKPYCHPCFVKLFG